MKNIFVLTIILSLLGIYYFNSNTSLIPNNVGQKETSLKNKIFPVKGNTIATRFQVPKGFERKELDPHSFGTFLRSLPLKQLGSKVKYFDGSIKPNHDIYVAVIDLDIGLKNLHQCADAIMRLRADYYWNEKLYDKIHFNFTNGFRVDYNKWMKGNRIKVEGNKTYWVKRTSASNTYKSYWNYLEIIFTYAGTLSLSDELIKTPINDIQIGDVFIQGGSPGHAEIVVDIAHHTTTDEKIFLLAQSYMPAQELQILVNPTTKNLSPWYSTKNLKQLNTPEWSFNISDLKRFEE